MLTVERARELLEYDPDTGFVTWRIDRRGGFPRGSRAGCEYRRQAGYSRRTIRVDGTLYQEHRVIWLLAYGVWPQHQIDHINHIATDNRLSNLRDVMAGENNRNTSKPRKNTSGTVGVLRIESLNKFTARIGVKRRLLYLGIFDSIEDAVAARKTAEHKYGFHENHGR